MSIPSPWLLRRGRYRLTAYSVNRDSSAIGCRWRASIWQGTHASVKASDQKCAGQSRAIQQSADRLLVMFTDAQAAEPASAGSSSVSSSANALTRQHRMAFDEACNILNVQASKAGLEESALQQMLKVSSFLALQANHWD